MTMVPTKAGYMITFLVCEASSSSHFNESMMLRSTPVAVRSIRRRG